jgi:Family of unknown function (DUF5317)
VILVVLVGLCLISVPLTGGDLRQLGRVELRCAWVGLLAVGLQVLITTVAPGGQPTLHSALHIASYVLVGIFLWVNRHLAGLPVLAAGALGNAAAILANGGVMPASRAAQRLAGLTPGSGFQNSGVLLHPHLLWLGDVIPVPGPSPLANVLSVGDCVIYAGLLLLLHRACRNRPAAAILTPP